MTPVNDPAAREVSDPPVEWLAAAGLTADQQRAYQVWIRRFHNWHEGDLAHYVLDRRSAYRAFLNELRAGPLPRTDVQDAAQALTLLEQHRASRPRGRAATTGIPLDGPTDGAGAGSAAAATAPGLDLRIHEAAEQRVTIQVTGEIDIATAPRVAGITELIRPGVAITVDLCEVTFLSAAGLSALLQLHDRARSAGGQLRVIGTDHRPVQVPLTVCQLDFLGGPDNLAHGSTTEPAK